jgi:hypothetical protein
MVGVYIAAGVIILAALLLNYLLELERKLNADIERMNQEQSSDDED